MRWERTIRTPRRATAAMTGTARWSSQLPCGSVLGWRAKILAAAVLYDIVDECEMQDVK